MNTLALLIGLGLIGGMFSKHSSFILMYGSVFEDLRTWIHTKKNVPGRGQWLFKKLNELITCQLCMTAQVSIWTVALPVMSILELRYPYMLSQLTNRDMPTLVEIIFFLFTWFVAAIANAAVAMAFWNLTEHLPAVLKEAQRFNRAKEEILSALAVNGAIAPVQVEEQIEQVARLVPALTYEEWEDLTQRFARNCDDIGCGYSRRTCREQTAEDYAKELAGRKRLDYFARRTLVRQIGLAAKEFVRLRHKIRNRDERARQVWETFESSFPQVREVAEPEEVLEPAEILTKESFREMLSQLADHCDAVSNEHERRTCRINWVQAFAESLAEQHQLSLSDQTRFVNTLNDASRQYHIWRNDIPDEGQRLTRVWDSYGREFEEIAA